MSLVPRTRARASGCSASSMIAPAGCLVPSRSSNANANMVMNGCKGIKASVIRFCKFMRTALSQEAWCFGVSHPSRRVSTTHTHSADAAAGHGRAGRDLEDRAHCAVVGSAEARTPRSHHVWGYAFNVATIPPSAALLHIQPRRRCLGRILLIRPTVGLARHLLSVDPAAQRNRAVPNPSPGVDALADSGRQR